MRPSRSPLALLATTVVACAPWYRDEELRGLRAVNDAREALAQAETWRAAGQRAQAIAAYERAVEANATDGNALLGLGRAYAEDGQRDRARVVLRFAMQAGGETAQPARIELVRVAWADGRPGEALDHLGPSTLPDAMAVPELASAYGDLIQARSASEAGRAAEALDKYAVWLSSHGLPDHPTVRSWSDAVLQSLASLVEPMRAAGEQSLAADDELGALARLAQAYRYLPSTAQDALLARLALAARRIASPDVLSPRALALAAEADAALGAGRLADAAAVWRRAVVVAPWSAAIRHEYALCLAATERYAEAVRQLDAYLLLIDPAGDTASVRRLRAAWAEGRPQ